MDKLDDTDLLCTVLAELPLASIASAAATCTRLRDLLKDTEASTFVWKTHICRRLDLPEDITDASSWDKALQVYHPTPTLLNSAEFLHTLSVDKLSARFRGPLGHDRAVRANVPVPKGGSFSAVRTAAGRHRVVVSSFFFFEVTISDAKDPDASEEMEWLRPCVSIGLATRHFPLVSKQTGWDRHSLGYHGDDGGLYHASGAAKQRVGPAFGAGDTVGCGIDLTQRLVFFTHNAKCLGEACRLSDDFDLDRAPLFATVGIDSLQRVQLNFGREAPFKFDVGALETRPWQLSRPPSQQHRFLYAFAGYHHIIIGGSGVGDGSGEEWEGEEEEDDEEDDDDDVMMPPFALVAQAMVQAAEHGVALGEWLEEHPLPPHPGMAEFMAHPQMEMVMEQFLAAQGEEGSEGEEDDEEEDGEEEEEEDDDDDGADEPAYEVGDEEGSPSAAQPGSADLAEYHY